jgi:hypothetical protein
MIKFVSDWYVNLKNSNIFLYNLTIQQIETFLKKI